MKQQEVIQNTDCVKEDVMQLIEGRAFDQTVLVEQYNACTGETLGVYTKDQPYLLTAWGALALLLLACVFTIEIFWQLKWKQSFFS